MHNNDDARRFRFIFHYQTVSGNIDVDDVPKSVIRDMSEIIDDRGLSSTVEDCQTIDSYEVTTDETSYLAVMLTVVISSPSYNHAASDALALFGVSAHQSRETSRYAHDVIRLREIGNGNAPTPQELLL